MDILIYSLNVEREREARRLKSTIIGIRSTVNKTKTKCNAM